MALNEEMAKAVEFVLKTIAACCKFPPPINGETIGHWGRLLTEADISPTEVRAMGDRVAHTWRDAPSLSEFETACLEAQWQSRLSRPVVYCWDGKSVRIGWGDADGVTRFASEDELMASLDNPPDRKRQRSDKTKEGGKRLLDSILTE